MMESGWTNKWRMYTDGRFAKSSKVATIKPTHGNAEVSASLLTLLNWQCQAFLCQEASQQGPGSCSAATIRRVSAAVGCSMCHLHLPSRSYGGCCAAANRAVASLHRTA